MSELPFLPDYKWYKGTGAQCCAFRKARRAFSPQVMNAIKRGDGPGPAPHPDHQWYLITTKGPGTLLRDQTQEGCLGDSSAPREVCLPSETRGLCQRCLGSRPHHLQSLSTRPRQRVSGQGHALHPATSVLAQRPGLCVSAEVPEPSEAGRVVAWGREEAREPPPLPELALSSWLRAAGLCARPVRSPKCSRAC